MKTNLPLRRALRSTLAALAACAVAARVAATTSVATEIQGVLTLAVPASTDTLVSPAFGRPAVWVGTAASSGATSITASGSPGWTANQFAPGTDTFFVRPLSGALSGHYFTIASNSATALTVDAAGLDLTTIQAGDQLEISPYWTLGTLYPAVQAGTAFVVSASTLARQTELLFYDPAGAGINRSPTETYFFFNSAWRRVGTSVATSFNGKVILPDSYFLQRNKAAATTLIATGRVFAAKLSTIIETLPAASQDNFAAVAFPMPTTLRNSGLITSGAFRSSPSALSRTDQLLFFDPAQTGTNRSPSSTFFFFNNGWRKVGSSVATDFSDTVTLTPGSGFILRKSSGSAAVIWTFNTNL